ncbi:MAG TPA: 4-hydroxyphenylacetate 3-hydroxylase N-terminal domain-containing protein [Caldimonas sp.]|jgi:4-hydroxybutyryl-CoA dehydratase/vinylacetyl-CoA-Delta-isomerase
MLISSQQYRESLRRYKPRVTVDGRAVESVADEPMFAPGIAAVGVSYDFALDPQFEKIMTATERSSGQRVNRMLHVNRTADDLLDKLEATRLVCREVGCAQRYIAQDMLNGLYQATRRCDANRGTDYHQRLLAYLHRVQEEDLAIGGAMTDAKGDRSRRPGAQGGGDAYVRIVEKKPGGIVIRGVKAIVTGAPYMHELIVMPCRVMQADEAAYAVCCAVPVDADGITIHATPAGRPGVKNAKFSKRFGQSTGVVVLDDVFVPWERVFLAGETEEAGYATTSYATHHRHSCVGARAGFGDLLIGAGAMMIDANGLDPERHHHVRDAMVELIKIVEGFYACGVASSVYASVDESGCAMPDPVFANVGKLLMSTQIYDMHRLAHEVSGGLLVALPTPDEDHNPAVAAQLDQIFAGRPGLPEGRRVELARVLEDLTVSSQGGWYSVISLHGGGSPEAMKREIWRHYPIAEKTALVATLLERGVLAEGSEASRTQPGKCCPTGCRPPVMGVRLFRGSEPT